MTAVDELAHHREVDVSLEQRDPDLPGGRVDVGLGQPALAAEALERRREAVLQGVEHSGPQVSVERARFSLLNSEQWAALLR